MPLQRSRAKFEHGICGGKKGGRGKRRCSATFCAHTLMPNMAAGKSAEIGANKNSSSPNMFACASVGDCVWNHNYWSVE